MKAGTSSQRWRTTQAHVRATNKAETCTNLQANPFTEIERDVEAYPHHGLHLDDGLLVIGRKVCISWSDEHSNTHGNLYGLQQNNGRFRLGGEMLCE